MAPDFKEFINLVQGDKTEQMMLKAQRFLKESGNDPQSIIACSLLLSVDLLGMYHAWFAKSFGTSV